MAKRRIVVGIAAAAVVAAGLAGCSGDKSSTGTSGGGNAAAPVGTKVVIDGKTQNVSGPVSCTQVNGNLSIGIGDPSTGVGAVVTNADPPVVQAVGLGNLGGATLGYSAGAPNQGTVQATKSGKSYSIKGTATGADTASPQQALTKSFEMDAACP